MYSGVVSLIPQSVFGVAVVTASVLAAIRTESIRTREVLLGAALVNNIILVAVTVTRGIEVSFVTRDPFTPATNSSAVLTGVVYDVSAVVLIFAACFGVCGVIIEFGVTDIYFLL
jgi:hypothetical protein